MGAVSIRQGEQLDELGGAAVLPRGVRNRPPVDEHLETAHQTHVEARHHTTLWRGTRQEHPNPTLRPANH